MEIRITFERRDPPEGWLLSGPSRCERVRFSGWLGLLQALSELAQRDDHPSRRAASAESSAREDTPSFRNMLET
jgi:hypothetical protein